jgi:hypothetical protein
MLFGNLASLPRYPLRDREHRPLSGEGGRRPGPPAPFWKPRAWRRQPRSSTRQPEGAKAKYRLLKRLPKLEADERLAGFDADTILCAVMETPTAWRRMR